MKNLTGFPLWSFFRLHTTHFLVGFFFFSVGGACIGKCPGVYLELPGVVSGLPGNLLGGKAGPYLPIMSQIICI